MQIWAYCLMPNQISSTVRGRPGAGRGRGASAVYAADQLPRKMARLSVARAFCFFRDGRAVSAGRRTVRGVESGARRPCGRRCGLAVEQRQIPSVGISFRTLAESPGPIADSHRRRHRARGAAVTPPLGRSCRVRCLCKFTRDWVRSGIQAIDRPQLHPGRLPDESLSGAEAGTDD